MPKLLVFAGPNGSGKSTVTLQFGIAGTYVNADEIKRAIQCTDIEAAKIAEQTREHLLANKMDFTFETVLSTDRNLKLIAKAKQSGYHVACIYVLTANPEINVSRVKQRFEKGGHSVPTDKIRERYKRALRIFPDLIPLCDELWLFDNSVEKADAKSNLLFKKIGNHFEFIPNNIWNAEMLTSLFNGTYPDDFIK